MTPVRSPAAGRAALEEELAALLYGGACGGGPARSLAGGFHDPRLAALDADELAEAARSVRRMVLGRTHRGTGGIAQWYPLTLAAWRRAHPEDTDLDGLAATFCASAHCWAWRESGGGGGWPPGISLEEALFHFFEEHDVGDAATREEELCGAVVRALAVTPNARFSWPAMVHAAPGGCYAVTSDGMLHAALDGRYLRGPITSLIAAVLRGEPTTALAADASVEQVRGELRRMRLLP
jgi:hypothetical protein